MENTLHSVRVGDINWLKEERFIHLLKLLKEYPCGISQIALFTTGTHIPLTLAESAKRMEIMKERFKLIREAGFSAGINILTTIGHHCEDLGHGLGDKYTYMTNIDGEVCKGSYCMRNPKYHEEYIIPIYTQMANTGTDFIWIDDDIRYGHMPIGNGCFCDGCIGSFNTKHGTAYTRESLKEALNKNDVELRKNWLDHQSDAICDIFAVIAKTVYSINENIKLGFMTGERYFEGYQFARYAEVLSDGGKHEIMWRPGGGAYNDTKFDAIVEKQEQTGRQTAYLPDYVTTVQYELENFPYQLLNKTPKSTAVEAAMCMTVGCTGTAFNILVGESGESPDKMIPHLKAINKLVPFYKTLAEETKGLKPEGIHTDWTTYSQAAVGECDYVHSSGDMFANYARELFSFGLPECYDLAKADVVMMKGQSAAVMSDEEIKNILSKGVYLNSSAIDYLHSRGFGENIGFTTAKQYPVDATECYTDHPINEGFFGGLRNCRQAFHGGDSFGFSMDSEKCEAVSKLIDYHDNVLTDCTCGIFVNELGGRVCAAGYYPHDWLSDSQKTTQLKRIFLWLSNGTLPSFVESFYRIRNITLTGNGKTCVTLFNTTNDCQENVTVAIRTNKNEAMLHTMYEGKKEMKADKTEILCGSEYKYFTVDKIEAYEGVIISL